MYGEVHQAGDPKVYKSRWHFCYRCGATQAFLGILFGKAALPREQSLFDTDLGDTFECAAHHLTFVMAPKKFCVRTKTLSKKVAKRDFFKTKLSHFFHRRYGGVMHDFFRCFKSPAKSAKKVPKSTDFGTFLVRVSRFELEAS